MKQSVKHLAAALALCLPFAAGARRLGRAVLHRAVGRRQLDHRGRRRRQRQVPLQPRAAAPGRTGRDRAGRLGRRGREPQSRQAAQHLRPAAQAERHLPRGRGQRRRVRALEGRRQAQALFRQARGHGPGRACQGRRAGSLAKPGPRRDLRHRRQAQRRQARGPRAGTGARHAPERPVRGRDRHLPDAAGRPARPRPGNDHRGRRHRYRDQVGEIKAKTDKDGKFSVKWPQPGLYWVEAGMEDAKVSVPQAKKRRLSYAGTLEVLKP